MDGWDVATLAGVLLVAAGWWLVWPPLVLFWLGVCALALGILGATARRTGGDRQ